MEPWREQRCPKMCGMGKCGCESSTYRKTIGCFQTWCLQRHPRTTFPDGFSLVRLQIPSVSLRSSSLQVTLSAAPRPLLRAAPSSRTGHRLPQPAFPWKEGSFSTSQEQHGVGKEQAAISKSILKMQTELWPCPERIQALGMLLPSTDPSSGRRPSRGTRPSRRGSWPDTAARG